MVPPTDPWYEDLTSVNPYDVNVAKQLLTEAGRGNGFSSRSTRRTTTRTRRWPPSSSRKLAPVNGLNSQFYAYGITTHRQLSDEELRAAGVAPGTVRLSVGTESVADLIWDLEQGFAHVAAAAGEAAVTA